MDNPGRHIMMGVEGTLMTRETALFIKEIGPRGIILFSRNYKNPRQLRKYISDINDAAGEGLMIAVDQEGGRVARLGHPFSKIPPMGEIGALEDGEARAREIGKLLGCELLSVGITLNFAPVLDVATNPFNPIIGDRSFSSDPDLVARLSLAFIEGMQSEGVSACGKHFPGHGDTNVDSHLGFAVLTHTRERFDACEFIPFQAAIHAGVAAIMTAHILAPNLDPLGPATVSRVITRDILRHEFGFGGLIFTDDLMMRGILDLYPPEESAWRALSAGADIALICHGCDSVRRAVQGIRQHWKDLSTI